MDKPNRVRPAFFSPTILFYIYPSPFIQVKYTEHLHVGYKQTEILRIMVERLVNEECLPEHRATRWLLSLRPVTQTRQYRVIEVDSCISHIFYIDIGHDHYNSEPLFRFTIDGEDEKLQTGRGKDS